MEQLLEIMRWLLSENCVAECGLEDIKSAGCYFIWNNKQNAEDRVFSKLGTVMGNTLWFHKFSCAEVVFLPEGSFDHSLMLVRCHNHLGRKASFRYNKMWSEAPNCSEKIRTCRSERVQGTLMFGVVQKLKVC